MKNSERIIISIGREIVENITYLSTGASAISESFGGSPISIGELVKYVILRLPEDKFNYPEIKDTDSKLNDGFFKSIAINLSNSELDELKPRFIDGQQRFNKNYRGLLKDLIFQGFQDYNLKFDYTKKSIREIILRKIIESKSSILRTSKKISADELNEIIEESMVAMSKLQSIIRENTQEILSLLYITKKKAIEQETSLPEGKEQILHIHFFTILATNVLLFMIHGTLGLKTVKKELAGSIDVAILGNSELKDLIKLHYYSKQDKFPFGWWIEEYLSDYDLVYSAKSKNDEIDMGKLPRDVYKEEGGLISGALSPESVMSEMNNISTGVFYTIFRILAKVELLLFPFSTPDITLNVSNTFETWKIFGLMIPGLFENTLEKNQIDTSKKGELIDLFNQITESLFQSSYDEPLEFLLEVIEFVSLLGFIQK
jgi:hypothetical protein